MLQMIWKKSTKNHESNGFTICLFVYSSVNGKISKLIRIAIQCVWRHSPPMFFPPVALKKGGKGGGPGGPGSFLILFFFLFCIVSHSSIMIFIWEELGPMDRQGVDDWIKVPWTTTWLYVRNPWCVFVCMFYWNNHAVILYNLKPKS